MDRRMRSTKQVQPKELPWSLVNFLCDYLGGYKIVIKATVLVVNNSKGDNFVSLFSSHVLLKTPCRHSTNQSRVKYKKSNAKNIARQKIVRALTKK